MEDELIQQRQNKLDNLKQKGIEPYGGKFDKSCFINDLLQDFKETQAVSTAGRLTAMRAHGKSLFGDLRDITGKIQVYIKEDTVGKENFELLNSIDIGDLIGVKGETFKTRTGEITVNVKEFKILSKSMRPLPEKWHGLKDIETRYRQRYVDLIVNEDSRKVFLARVQIINAIREFLNKKGFLEVETPMMQPVPGGAAAKPFVTHHNALHMDLYLRIAPELYLKRLLVGGFDRVYEINRNFRNEGISVRHNPEFTMLEVYAAYANCDDMMDLTEDLAVSLASGLFGKEELEFKGNLINIKKPWKRVKLYDAVKEATGTDFRQETDIKKKAAELGVEIQEGQNEGDILNNIFEKYVEPKLIQPTFVTDYPAILCPLAKKKKDDPAVTDRFELFVSSIELANAYSELNDPQEQRSRFEEQKKFKKLEREVGIDEDFLRALEYGMPPAGGLGIGIDRLVMLFTNQDSIRDVILFPQLRPEK